MPPLLRTGLVAFLALVPLAALADGEDADAALIERVGAHLVPRGKLATLTRALGKEPDESRDLGFGCAWTRFELYGDALTLYVDAVTYRSWVTGLRVSSFGVQPELAKRIRRAWGERVRIRDDRLELRSEKPHEMMRLRRAFWKGLEGPRRADLALPSRPAGRTLADPLAELTFGQVCYEDGSAPAGRELATTLWRTGSQDALDAVLVGPNPEGRVYAAEMLLRLAIEGEVIGEDRRERIRRVLALDVPIRCCDGCLVSDRRGAAVVSEAALREGVLCRVHVRAAHMGHPYTKVRVIVHRDGLRMAQRHAAPGVMACIPLIDRAAVPSELLHRLGAAVEKGAGVERRDGLPTFRIEPGRVAEAPKAVRDLLTALPEWGR